MAAEVTVHKDGSFSVGFGDDVTTYTKDGVVIGSQTDLTDDEPPPGVVEDDDA